MLVPDPSSPAAPGHLSAQLRRSNRKKSECPACDSAELSSRDVPERQTTPFYRPLLDPYGNSE
jgi:hypothetical protein